MTYQFTVSVKDIRVLQKQLNKARKEWEQLEQKLRFKKDEQEQKLKRMISKYNQERVEAVKSHLQSQGLTYCTKCFSIIPEIETQLVFLQGQIANYLESEGCPPQMYVQGISSLYKVCQDCYQECCLIHKKRVAGKIAENNTSFNTFKVEKREDGYYASVFEKTVKLENEKCKLSKPFYTVVDEIAKQIKLPPPIRLDHDCGEHMVVVVGEKWLR